MTRFLKSFKTYFLLLLFVTPAVTAQVASDFSFETHESAYHFTTSDGLYVLHFYNADILEVNFYPSGTSADDYDDSHAVVMEPIQTQVQVVDEPDFIRLYSDGITVRYDISAREFSFFYDEKQLLKEHNGFQLNEEDAGYSVDFSISETEALMGGGSRALGMNRRGHKLELYNKAHYGYEYRSELKNFTLPIIISSNKYMVHFDNPTTGFLDLDSRNDHTIGFEAFSGRKTYHIISGENWPRIIQNYTSLTGLQPLPPRWTFGNYASRFGYRSQEEVLNTIEEFKKKEVPVDAVIIDLYWFGPDIKGHLGNLAFDSDFWPNPADMIRELENQGVKTVLITEPFVLTSSKRWDEVTATEGIIASDSLGNPGTYDFYFGNTGLIDVFHPNGIDWFWGIYQELKETYGIHGWWGDLGEPEVHPDWLQHHIGSAREVHNIYGHQWAKLLYEGYAQHYPDKRPFNLMRAGYAGSQRYGMIPWTGDVSRNWGGLQPQPELSLQMGLQGLAYLHSDLGGFAWPNKDPELYARWMQYGVFQPVYRPHAQDDVPSEPVFWDDETLELTKTAIELRYQLLPYIYSAAFDNSTTGIPFMRPLFFEEPDNFKFHHISETYLFGDDILVAPVLRQGAKAVTLHAPNTANWYDFYTAQKYTGGMEHQIPTRTESTPVFVRGGAIIPMADLVQTTDDYSVSHLNLHYYFDEDASSYKTHIYHDDGLTKNAHKKGAYEILHITNRVDSGTVLMTFEKEIGRSFESEFSDISMIIRNIEKAPRRIRIDNQRVDFKYDASSQTVTVNRFSLKDNKTELQIRL